MTDASTTSSMTSSAVATPNGAFRTRWSQRPAGWWSEAFAAGGAILAGIGVLEFGLDISQTWAEILIGLYVAAAYLLEPFLARSGQAACTTAVALGTPAFVALVVFPIHTYNGVRILMVATIAIWFTCYIVGGTRGRMVLLALAVTFLWLFVTLEVGHVQSVARNLNPFALTSRSVFGTGASSSSGNGFGQCTFGNDGTMHCPNDGSVAYGNTQPKSPADYSLGIGIESLAFGAVFLGALRAGDRSRREGFGTTFAIPAVLALITAVTALGNKLDHLWLAGLLALVVGLVIGMTANGRRRFLTWTGALMSAVGVGLVAGDVADSIWGNKANSNRYFGATFFVFGIVSVAAAILFGRILGEARTPAVEAAAVEAPRTPLEAPAAPPEAPGAVPVDEVPPIDPV